MKQRCLTKWLGLLMALAMLLSGLGCFGASPSGRPTPPEPSDPPTITLEETAEPTPEPTPAPNALFAELDADFFRFYMGDDAAFLHQLVKNPAALGFESKDKPDTLGDFSEKADKSWIRECKKVLAELEKLDYAGLSPANQFAYDTLAQYLGYEIAGETFYGYYEPLGIVGGVHTSLPFVFTLFEIGSETDAELYLRLLADVPRYLTQVLDYEKVRNEKEIFMTQEGRFNVENRIKKIINAKPDKNPMLIMFDKKVNALNDLSDETKADLIARNKELVTGAWNQAYRDLMAGLKPLKTRKSVPLCKLFDPDDEDEYFSPDPYMEYYELQLREQSGMDGSVARIRRQLLAAMDIIWEELEAAQYSGPLKKRKERFTAGTLDGNMDYLKELTEGFLPKLSEHNVEKVMVPKELEDLFAPAAYLIPGIDDWTENVVIFNDPDSDKYQLLTMAHESYPGHLYMFNYQRSLPKLSLMQKTLPFTSYYEAWSQFAEYQVAKRTELYPQNQLLVDTLLDSAWLIQLMLISIDVNYLGCTAREIQNAYGVSGGAASYYHMLFRNDPFIYMEYGFGIANMFVLYDKVKNEKGDEFDEAAFLKEFLDLGPSYFNLIEERMGKTA